MFEHQFLLHFNEYCVNEVSTAGLYSLNNISFIQKPIYYTFSKI